MWEKCLGKYVYNTNCNDSQQSYSTYYEQGTVLQHAFPYINSFNLITMSVG